MADGSNLALDIQELPATEIGESPGSSSISSEAGVG